MPFGLRTLVGPMNHAKGQFWGVKWRPIVKCGDSLPSAVQRTAEVMELQFGTCWGGSREPCVGWQCKCRHGKGHFWGVWAIPTNQPIWPIEKHCIGFWGLVKGWFVQKRVDRSWSISPEGCAFWGVVDNAAHWRSKPIYIIKPDMQNVKSFIL